MQRQSGYTEEVNLKSEKEAHLVDESLGGEASGASHVSRALAVSVAELKKKDTKGVLEPTIEIISEQQTTNTLSLLQQSDTANNHRVYLCLPEGVVEGLAQGLDEPVHLVRLELRLRLGGQVLRRLRHHQVRTVIIERERKSKEEEQSAQLHTFFDPKTISTTTTSNSKDTRSTHLWLIAPRRASTMPRGFMLVSLPTLCASHRSATVP